MPTQYKVLQNQKDSCFVKCVRMLYNGKVQFYYMPGNCKTFASLLPMLTAESFVEIVANLLKDIVQVRNIGFLSCEQIDISFEKVFVDPTTRKVTLIYVPIVTKLHQDSSAFENELRTGLIKLINNLVNLSSPRTMQLSVDLANGTLSIEDIFKRLAKGTSGIPHQPGNLQPGNHQPGNQTPGASLRLTGINTPTKVELVVNKSPFVIGKSPEADGQLVISKYIGRRHCQIERHSGQYYITDLDSVNHTWVNRGILQPNKPFRLNNGDVVRLANVDLRVSI
jgi:hypothetical protein